MAVNTYTVGSGGDYATVALWQGGRSAVTAPGDTEVCLLLDDTAASNSGTLLIVTSYWKAGNVLRFKGNAAHNGDPSAAIKKVGTISSTTCWLFSITSYEVEYEFEDLAFDLAGMAAYNRQVLFYANSPTDNPVCGPTTFRRCFFIGQSGSNLNVISYELALASCTANVNLYFENCVGYGFTGSNCRILRHSYSGTGNRLVQIDACTFQDYQLLLDRNGSHTLTLNVVGSLLKPYTGGEYSTSNSATTIVASSNYCITSRSSAAHATLFGTATNNTYSTTFVSGNPSSGQVGFTDTSTFDYSLYDDADNIAIDYVDAVMPSDDIAGLSRPQGSLYDAGAFELEVTASSEFFPAGLAYEYAVPAPSVVITTHYETSPAVAQYEYTASVPTVSVTTNYVVTPASAQYEYYVPSPAITVTTYYVASPAALQYEYVVPAPTSTVTTNFVCTPTHVEYEYGLSTATISVVAPALAEFFPAAAEYHYFIPAPTESVVSATTVKSYGEFSIPIQFFQGEEFLVTLSGPSADTPTVRITLRFEE